MVGETHQNQSSLAQRTIFEKKKKYHLAFLFCSQKIIKSLSTGHKLRFMPVAVDTSGRIDDDFSRLQFLYAHSEASALTNELC
jgi:hypothetical protein